MNYENYVKDNQKIIQAIKDRVPGDDQVDMLLSLGLSSKEIKALKYEEDRVNKIMELQAKGVGTMKKKTKIKTKPGFIM